MILCTCVLDCQAPALHAQVQQAEWHAEVCAGGMKRAAGCWRGDAHLEVAEGGQLAEHLDVAQLLEVELALLLR